jgi:mono/diheme cytochrome c family protein
MRRTALALPLLVAVVALAAVGCGGEEEATPTPSTVQGPVATTPSTTTTTSTTPALKGDATAGKAVFTGSAGCTGCHTLADAGSTGTVGPNLDQLKPPFDAVVTQVTNGGAAMPPFKGTLTPQQIADVAAYVSSVAGK